MLLTQGTVNVLITFVNIVTVCAQECGLRDLVAAGRKCHKPCLQDGTCRKNNKECVCDGFCGLSCLKKRCPPIREPLHGNVIINPYDRTIGAQVTYSCNNGYVISGQTNRECQEDKTWSGDEPMCTLSTARDTWPECTERDEEAAGRNCGKACQPDGTCKKQNRECVCDGLCGLTCLKKRCPPLLAPRNGSLVISPQDRTIGAEVTYSCNNGYVISGRRNRICRANKMWSGTQPTCNKPATKVQCPLLELSDGILEYRDENDRIIDQPHHGDIRRATCSEGHVLNGMPQSICSSGAWQHALPSCQRLPCPILDLEDGAVAYLDKNNQMVFEPHHGDIRVAVCRDGRTLRGTSHTRCMSGSWQDELPSCEVGQCRIPSCPSNGRWTVYGIDCGSNRMVDNGFRLTYQCNTGFFKCQQIEPVCNNRLWEPSTRNLCVPLGCNFVTLRDSHLTASYTYDGTTECFHPTLHQQHTVVEYSCNLGYKIHDGDPPQATCVGRSWLPQQQPVCVEVTCPYIQLQFGSVTYQQNGPYTSNRGHTATARFHCIEGYRLEGHTISCNNGVWSDTIPTCVEEPCSVHYVEQYNNMDVEYVVPSGSNENTPGQQPPRTTVNFICRQYGFEASQSKKCERGIWRGDDPQCSRIRCDHEALENGDVTYTLDGNEQLLPVHGVIRSYDCDPGFIIDNNDPSECDAGTWTRRLPVCIERPCNKDDLLDGEWDFEIQYSSVGEREESEGFVSPRTVATLRCNTTGYETTGRDRRTCRRGEWDGQNPSCERIRCQTIQLENGAFKYQDIDSSATLDPHHGDIRNAICDRGYVLQGAEEAQCWDGEWEGELPICIEVTCPTENIDNGRVTNDDLRPFTQQATHGDRRRFTCESGYTIDGEDRSQCLDGEWTQEKPTCIEASARNDELIQEPIQGMSKGATCRIESIANGDTTRRDGSRFTQDARHDEWRRVTCDDGYILVGQMWSICRSGRWSPESPTCEGTQCPAVENNGEYERILYHGQESAAQSFLSGTVLEVDCAEGRVLEGPMTSVCRRGLWNPPRLLCVLAATCQEVPAEEGRTIDYTDNTENQKQHNSHLTVTCGSHMVRFGQITSTCLRGAWSPPVAHCKENLALGKVAYQVNTDYDGDASRAVDGITSGRYDSGSCTHTSRQSNTQWWYVDLGSSVLVQEIVIYNRQDYNHQSRLLHAKVRVGDETSDVTLNSLAGTVNNIEINPIHLKLTPPIEGRIVSVSELNPGNPLALCEVQVFGEIRGCVNGCEVPYLQNGYFTPIHGRTRLQPLGCVSLGSNILVHCEEGLIREGSYYYQCQQSGRWFKPGGVDATCQVCPSGHCVVPSIENGHYLTSLGGAPLVDGSCTSRTYLHVVCDDGMQHVGSRYYLCREGKLYTRNDGNVFTLCT